MKTGLYLISLLFSASVLNADIYKYDDSLQIYLPKDSVITATKTEEPIEHIGKWMTVITKEDMERNGDITVLEAIRNFPGLHIIPEGPFGGVTKSRLRGGKPGDVLVLIDGVKVNNPISEDESFDWGTLSTASVERIEIIRNSQSSLYGSDAVSGVINIITKKGKTGIKAEGGAWAKPYGTFSERAGISGGNNKFDYSLDVFNINAEGISRTVSPADSQPAPEKDGYTNREVFTKVNTYLFNNFSIGLSSGFRDSRVDMDAGPFKDDSNAVSYFTSRQNNLSINHRVSSLWNYKLNLGVNSLEGRDENGPDMADTVDRKNTYEADYAGVELQNNLVIKKLLRITAGLGYTDESGKKCNCERTTQRIDSIKIGRNSLYNRSAYIEVMPNYNNLFFNLSGRLDNYRDIGTYGTYQASLSFLVNSTRFKSNYGAGLKMPTIYQLFSPEYGNTELTPEMSHSFDVGGEHRFREGVIELLYFNQHIGNAIDLLYLPDSTLKYQNKGKDSEWCSEGIEVYFLLHVTKNFSTDVSFTGTDKIDAPEDYLLVPSLDYRWGVSYKWFNVKFCCIGKRQDNDYIKGIGIADIRSCAKIDVTNSFKFKGLKIQFKVENLKDDSSMESYGYTSLGRGFSVGIGY